VRRSVTRGTAYCFFVLRPVSMPSRPRRCACPPGESPADYPRRAKLGAPRCRRTGLRRLGQKSAATAAVEPASRCLGHEVHLARDAVHVAVQSGRPWPRSMAGRAVVLRIEPPAGFRPCRALIIPSLRSADASGLASSFGPARFACRAVGTQGWPLPGSVVSPDSITLSATVVRDRVPSRRTGPCPRCAAGRTHPALASLTAPVRALLTVAGDELRKDGGSRANRVPRADRTEQPQRLGSESRNPVFLQQPSQEKDMLAPDSTLCRPQASRSAPLGCAKAYLHATPMWLLDCHALRARRRRNDA